MKRPIFFSSFFSIHWKGSKFFTSPAILQSNAAASKCVIGPTPLTPAMRFFQLSSVPIPSAQTSPTPVTTTRRVTVFRLLTGFQGLYLQTLTRKRLQGLYLRSQAGLQALSDKYLDAARNAPAYLDLACLSMYSTASFTVVIFSASSSGTSMPNASSNAITNSTWSSESAPRSSTNDAVGVTSASSTPSCSTIICLTRSSTLAIPVPPRSLNRTVCRLVSSFPRLFACTTRAEYSRAKIVGLDPSEQPAHSIYPAPQGQLWDHPTKAAEIQVK